MESRVIWTETGEWIMYTITGWNLNPNQHWYVKISDAGSDALVKLFNTEADASGDLNLVASGNVAFGTNSELVLIMEENGDPEISYFNSLLTYHLLISGADSDPTITYHIAPFVDLPEIDNSIYRDSGLILKKATYEINAHTHMSKNRTVVIVNHEPALSVGNVCTIDSVRRGINTKTFIENIIIEGTKDSLVNQIETVEYTDLTYE